MHAAPIEKHLLIDAWRALLRARLDGLARSSTAARDGTRVDGDHRPANRGERAAVTSQGYLAHGLAQRMADIQSTMDLLGQLAPGPTARVRAGALVHIETEEGEEQLLFIVPGAQGDRLLDTTLISPRSPMARALAGREEGDGATIEIGGRRREVVITGVW